MVTCNIVMATGIILLDSVTWQSVSIHSVLNSRAGWELVFSQNRFNYMYMYIMMKQVIPE